MSYTPLTDAEAASWETSADAGDYVPVSFARDLELKLAEAEKEHRRVFTEFEGRGSQMVEQLRAQLTARTSALRVMEEALKESAATIQTAKKHLPNLERSKVVMTDGLEVSHQEMCNLTLAFISLALAKSTEGEG